MKTILGLLVIGFGVFVEITWLGICFGSVVIGILLLIFAPRILFFPFTFFLLIGLAIINPEKYSRSSARYQRYTHNQSNKQHYTDVANSLASYYIELESTPLDNMEDIKKNYRRLIKEYHYDSIVSKNLPEDILVFAEEKTKKLNEAYSAIKKAR